ncbi:hypothetical protein [Oceanotoga teriensis]|uniref:hypothetical protein n=1 Tax=Oceanotoga teriensis TaxID=515440 RepID=UPI0027123CA4|nr:hypothetical protein [Oceanotoga teriensis]MDO7975318.1 hypothetical protein [Oceanotoga teriensis]
MKKTLILTLFVLLTISLFSAKFILANDPKTNNPVMYNLENFDQINIDAENLILTKINNNSYSSNESSISISLLIPAEIEKYKKVDEMINNGYIVKAPSDSKYFGSISIRNLTTAKIKSVKTTALLKDISDFMGSNKILFDLRTWINLWVMEIPVN